MSYLGYIFPLLFIGMWILITFIISKMGWADLVANFKSDEKFVGKRVGLISASINNANYNKSFILKYNEKGIYLKPIFIFRLFHKPVLIPWKEIKESRAKKFLFYNFRELIVGHPFVAIISLKESVFSKIESNWVRYSITK